MKKARFETPMGQFEVEGDTDQELFKEMAATHEIYADAACGLCQCKHIVPVVRKNKDEELFFEVHCQGLVPELGPDGKPATYDNGQPKRVRCRAYLYLGQNKKGGGLFPVRQLDEKGKPDRETGKFGRHNGWTRYRGEPKPDAAAEAPTKPAGKPPARR